MTGRKRGLSGTSEDGFLREAPLEALVFFFDDRFLFSDLDALDKSVPFFEVSPAASVRVVDESVLFQLLHTNTSLTKPY
ncbi:MAG: hypothetical protein OXI96_02275 [Acidimicrobiaceae bacterium]|nr:hypothetical protein [Acidimicrobiaceae bacterium]